MSVAVNVPQKARKTYGLPKGDLVVVSAFNGPDEEHIGVWFAKGGEERAGQRWPATVLRSDLKVWTA